MNISLNKLAAYILIPFSGFYLAGLNAISPVYIFFCLSLYIVPLIKLFNGRTYFDRTLVLSIFYVIYLILTQLLLDPHIGVLSNVIISLMYYILSHIILFEFDKNNIVYISKIFIYISILILSIESIWRLSHPVYIMETGIDYRNIEGGLFYAYKRSSIMFTDSNFVGIFSLNVLFLNFFLLMEKLWENRVTLILLTILTVLTFSRSAIITALLSFLLLPILFGSSTINKKIILSTALIACTLFVISLIGHDTSLQSKFKIFSLTIDHFSSASILGVLFGVGFGNAVNYLGIGAHNLFLTHLIESGALGLLVFLILQFYLVYKSNGKTLYLTLPLFISGFALVGHAIPFYYASLAIIYSLTKKTNI